MNDASNFPESEQPEGIPTASDAAQEADANTSAQAQTPADDNAAAARTCPQCGAAMVVIETWARGQPIRAPPRARSPP